jgi:glycosyltransferase involved in cell wall biosynthesis
MIRAVTISAALKSQYLADLPHLENKVTVAHDGANIEIDVGEIRHVSPGYRVGYVGSLFPGRGIELIIALARECEFAQFDIIGGTLDEISLFQKELCDLNNIYMHGYQPNSIAMKMLKDFDVVLAPYGSKVSVHGDAQADTSAFMSPLKLFEYMAAGKAIICSDHEVLQEVITHEETALICERENVVEWVVALRRLWQDPYLRITLGERARDVCKRKYSWRARAEYVINFKSED